MPVAMLVPSSLVTVINIFTDCTREKAEAGPQLLVAARAAPYVNDGPVSRSLTPVVGDLVATPNSYRSLALKGFSEDLNEDGFVDPLPQLPQLFILLQPLLPQSSRPL